MAYGGLRSFSDRVAELDTWGLAAVRDLLRDGGSRAPSSLDQIRAGGWLAGRELCASRGSDVTALRRQRSGVRSVPGQVTR